MLKKQEDMLCCLGGRGKGGPKWPVKIHVHSYKFDRIVIVSSKAVIFMLTNQWPEQVRKHQLTCTIHWQVLSVSGLSCMNNKYLNYSQNFS